MTTMPNATDRARAPVEKLAAMPTACSDCQGRGGWGTGERLIYDGSIDSEMCQTCNGTGQIARFPSVQKNHTWDVCNDPRDCPKIHLNYGVRIEALEAELNRDQARIVFRMMADMYFERTKAGGKKPMPPEDEIRAAKLAAIVEVVGP